jgi:hypothetical protein
LFESSTDEATKLARECDEFQNSEPHRIACFPNMGLSGPQNSQVVIAATIRTIGFECRQFLAENHL